MAGITIFVLASCHMTSFNPPAKDHTKLHKISFICMDLFIHFAFKKSSSSFCRGFPSKTNGLIPISLIYKVSCSFKRCLMLLQAST